MYLFYAGLLILFSLGSFHIYQPCLVFVCIVLKPYHIIARLAQSQSLSVSVRIGVSQSRLGIKSHLPLNRFVGGVIAIVISYKANTPDSEGIWGVLAKGQIWRTDLCSIRKVCHHPQLLQLLLASVLVVVFLLFYQDAHLLVKTNKVCHLFAVSIQQSLDCRQ